MEALINTQIYNKHEFEKFIVNLKKTSKDKRSEGFLTKKQECLDQLWATIKETNRKMLEIYSKDDETLPYFRLDIYSELEDSYCMASSFIFDHLKPFKEATGSYSPDNKNRVISENSELKLPRISIPRFSGSYQAWSSFHDLFVAIVHSNNQISNVQKLHYLKTSLSGEAEQLIRHVQITDVNYLSAWEILVKRYQNNRALVNAQLNILMTLPNQSGESTSGLKTMLDVTNEVLEALKGLKINIDNWDPLLIFILSQKLSRETISHWELLLSSRVDACAIPTIEEFKVFLESRFRTLEAISASNTTNTSNNKNQGGNKKPPVKRSHVAVNAAKCPICSEDHRLRNCENFLKMTIKDRHNFIKRQQRCFNCLALSHSSQDCKNPMNCQKCNKRHNTLLHFDRELNNNKSPQGQTGPPVIQGNSNFVQSSNVAPSQNTQMSNEDSTYNDVIHDMNHLTSHFSKDMCSETVLLATALIHIYTPKGEKAVLRALIDQGSQASFITEDAVQRLQLYRKPTHAVVSGLGTKQANVIRSSISCKITAHFHSSYEGQLDAFVLKRLTGLLPAQNVTTQPWPHIEKLQLADPNYYVARKVDILLGADIYADILKEGVIKGPSGTPLAQETTLGWILSGQLFTTRHQSSFHVKISSVNDDNLEFLLRQFWEIENISSDRKPTYDEEDCEKQYTATHTRNDDGRYIVKLPFKGKGLPEIVNSKPNALTRLLQMEKRFRQNSDLHIKYLKFMEEYSNLDHMEEVREFNIQNKDTITTPYFLPHHAVLKEDSTTTKLRVVFDASSKNKGQKSLNDNLHVGPTLQDELSVILLRWRKHQVVFTADIEKMYRQILVSKDHQDFQRILWRNSIAQPIQEFRLKTVTYGMSCAPYLAIRTLRQLAIDEKVDFPVASKITLKDFYVDDVMSGANSVEEALEIQNQLRGMLHRGGFYLRKWTSNRERIIENVPNEDRELKKPFDIEFNETVKTLGVHWNPVNDEFGFCIKLKCVDKPITKRLFLAEVSRLFDPLGWLAPIVIIAKIMFQKLWLSGIGWDDELPDLLASQWENYRKELYDIQSIKIPRWINYQSELSEFELHGFCDASIHAYAAVVYFRCVDSEGTVYVSLLLSKTRVAPIKQISLPRLELCGAVLLSKLLKKVKDSMQIEAMPIHAWTDSTIVLAWLRALPNKWKTFVANRVSEIQQNSNISQWRHVISSDNPADCASRGLTPSILKQHTLWWSGPEWLKSSSEMWPTRSIEIGETQLEEKGPQISANLAAMNVDILGRFSSFRRCIRVVAYCFRFCHNIQVCETERRYQHLRVSELKNATRSIIKIAQHIDFHAEITCLKNNKKLPENSRILNLNPFLDQEEILRVGGRLNNSFLSYDEKHPIILSDKSQLTKLIIDDTHRNTVHGGTQLMLNVIRKKYWLLRARMVVKHQIHKCLKCYRHSALPRNQLMGELPEPRVKVTRPFCHTGIDYSGPVTIKETKCRGRVKTSKGYIAVFICLTTKAVHLEAVSDMTTDAFLAAFSRFTSRRGLCADLYSDCGTNFVGANAQLIRDKLKYERETEELKNILSSKGTEWHFIPPASPHFGGLWEAGVKSMKYHLKRVLGNALLTFEEISTALAQIEACLNSRPLCPITADPEDCTALTPGHFLIGDMLLSSPHPNLIDKNVPLTKRWLIIRRMQQEFWKRWSSEYLSRLQQRPKWISKQPNVQKGNLVLIKDERLPPCKWLLGRVIELHSGADSLVRVVTVQCENSVFKRPITKICMLPIHDNEVDNINVIEEQ